MGRVGAGRTVPEHARWCGVQGCTCAFPVHVCRRSTATLSVPSRFLLLWQLDTDTDTFGDVCDLCPAVASTNADQVCHRRAAVHLVQLSSHALHVRGHSRSPVRAVHAAVAVSHRIGMCSKMVMRLMCVWLFPEVMCVCGFHWLCVCVVGRHVGRTWTRLETSAVRRRRRIQLGRIYGLFELLYLCASFV